jgi:cysteine-rich repeat protein
VTGPICGDGNVEGTEQCDDGNVLNGDGCSFSCQVEAGWNCEGTPSSCTQLPPTPIDRGMKLFKDVLINSNNAFILVQTDK